MSPRACFFFSQKHEISRNGVVPHEGYEYMHAPHMYDLDNWPNKKLFVGSMVGGIVVGCVLEATVTRSPVGDGDEMIADISHNYCTEYGQVIASHDSSLAPCSCTACASKDTRPGYLPCCAVG